jgi:ubiquinone/menaquinone biosynthesis C-methylase UbiE
LVETKRDSIDKVRKSLNTKKTEFQKDIFSTGEYIKHFNPDDRRNPFWKIYDRKKKDVIALIESLETKGSILDIGGGSGRLALALARVAQRIILADVSIDMLKAVQEAGSEAARIKIVNADAHRLPCRDSSFDIVVGLDLFCHLEHPKDALGEFNRVLKERGRLILDSTNSNPLWAIFYPRYMGMNPLNWLRILRHQGILPEWKNIVRHYTKSEFNSFLLESGFQITRKINYGPMLCPKWFLIVAEKD